MKAKLSLKDRLLLLLPTLGYSVISGVIMFVIVSAPLFFGLDVDYTYQTVFECSSISAACIFVYVALGALLDIS